MSDLIARVEQFQQAVNESQTAKELVRHLSQALADSEQALDLALMYVQKWTGVAERLQAQLAASQEHERV